MELAIRIRDLINRQNIPEMRALTQEYSGVVTVQLPGKSGRDIDRQQRIRRIAFLLPPIEADINPMGGIKDVRIGQSVSLSEQMYQFDGLVLAQAIRQTFDWRQTTLTSDPVALSAAFAQRPEKEMQWRAFVNRHRLEGTPDTLHEIVQALSVFLLPIVRALSSGQPFGLHWPAGGPWT